MCQDWQLSGWELSGGQLSGLGIVRIGNSPGGNCRGWQLSGWELSGGQLSGLGIVRVGIVRGGIVWGVIVRGDSSRGELSGNRVKHAVTLQSCLVYHDNLATRCCIHNTHIGSSVWYITSSGTETHTVATHTQKSMVSVTRNWKPQKYRSCDHSS